MLRRPEECPGHEAPEDTQHRDGRGKAVRAVHRPDPHARTQADNAGDEAHRYICATRTPVGDGPVDEDPLRGEIRPDTDRGDQAATRDPRAPENRAAHLCLATKDTGFQGTWQLPLPKSITT